VGAFVLFVLLSFHGDLAVPRARRTFLFKPSKLDVVPEVKHETLHEKPNDDKVAGRKPVTRF
jgi:hypothetical protein